MIYRFVAPDGFEKAEMPAQLQGEDWDTYLKRLGFQVSFRDVVNGEYEIAASLRAPGNDSHWYCLVTVSLDGNEPEDIVVDSYEDYIRLRRLLAPLLGPWELRRELEHVCDQLDKIADHLDDIWRALPEAPR